MSGCCEVDRCNYCSEIKQVSRKYYHYPIACECCGTSDNTHFEIVKYCKDCEDKVRPPREIKPVLKLEPIRER